MLYRTQGCVQTAAWWCIKPTGSRDGVCSQYLCLQDMQWCVETMVDRFAHTVDVVVGFSRYST